MNNELERILGEVADGASHRSAALPVEQLRTRGVRRRRTRQAGFSAVGVAAAFGLAFGVPQLWPDGATPVQPALASADASLPVGACGSIVENMPVVDGALSIRQRQPRVLAVQGEDVPASWFVDNVLEPHTWDERDVAALLVIRDGTVVGWSWHQGALPEVPENDTLTLEGFGPVVACETGQLAPQGDPSQAQSLPAGEYATHAVILTPTQDPAELGIYPGDAGTLTLLPAGSDPGPDLDGVVIDDVDLPECGEPIAGYEFPAGTLVGTGDSLEVSSARPDSISVQTGWRNTVAEGALVHNDDLAAVVARDGVVVTYIRAGQSSGGGTPLALGADAPFGTTWEWLECSGENDPTTLPAGDYELLAVRIIQLEVPKSANQEIVVGFEPVPFTIEDGAEGEDSEGDSSAPDVALPACGEPITSFVFPAGSRSGSGQSVGASAVHSGSAEGEAVVFRDGYGDQISIQIGYLDHPEGFSRATQLAGGVVVARDGVVVAELPLDQLEGLRYRTDGSTSIGMDAVVDWLDCEGTRGQVPKGDYELLGWQKIRWTNDEGDQLDWTSPLGPLSFTVYDFEDPDNPGPSQG